MFIKFNVAVAGVLTAAAFMISAATGEEQQVSRAAVKKATSSAEKAGQLAPGGQGRDAKVSRTSNKTSSHRKAEPLQTTPGSVLLPQAPQRGRGWKASVEPGL
jgi:hypothetical protein